MLDFAGHPKLDWSLTERAQRAVQNWQATGQLRGVKKNNYVVEGKDDVKLGVRGGAIWITSDGREAALGPDAAAVRRSSNS